jgi:hypothetical protein
MHLTAVAAALIKGPRGRPAFAPSSAKRFQEMING